MTDHTIFQERICAMLDGELADNEAAALRSHLNECPDCRAFLDAMKTVYGLSARDLPDAPPDLSKNVMERVRAQAAANQSRRRIIRFPFRALAAAAAAAVVLWAGARSLPLFRAKSADSAVSEAGSVQDSAVFSAAEAADETAGSAGPDAYGAVNGSALFDASAVLSEPASEAAPEEGAYRALHTVTVHGTTLMWNGEPFTLSELEDELIGAAGFADGVALVLEDPDPETESAVRALLEALKIPVREP